MGMDAANHLLPGTPSRETGPIRGLLEVRLTSRDGLSFARVMVSLCLWWGPVKRRLKSTKNILPEFYGGGCGTDE